MENVLLTSEKFVKEQTDIDDNVAGKFLRPSIQEAQDIELEEVLGSCLKGKLVQLVGEGLINDPEYAAYKELLDRCQYYLAYMALIGVMHKVPYKTANAGVVKTPDERVVNATDTEIDRNIAYYQGKADSCCYRLQTWLLQNSSAFPELAPCDCDRISSNLRSAATCGIWLGGPRGKRLPGTKVRRDGR